MKKLLSSQIIIKINNEIHLYSLEDTNIIYGNCLYGEEKFYVPNFKINKLTKSVPKNKSIIEIGAYYLKNIIMLQSFSDGNHRTALISTIYFLEKNNYDFNPSSESYRLFNIKFENLRYNVYGYKYETMSTKILKEKDNDVYFECVEYIKNNLRKIN